MKRMIALFVCSSVLKYDYETGWTRFFEKLHGFFTDKFESDWEKKTGSTWQEGRRQ